MLNNKTSHSTASKFHTGEFPDRSLATQSFQPGLRFTSVDGPSGQKPNELKETKETETAGHTASQITTKLHRALDYTLQLIAADPQAEASIARAAVNIGYDIVPFLGPLKKFADARALYRTADPVLMEEGRRLCLIAVLEAALDIGTLGGSAFMPDELITGLRTAGDYYRRAARTAKGVGLSKDPLSLLAGAVLKFPYLSKSIDTILTPPAGSDKDSTNIQ